jgi:hypothetical protein
MERLVEFLINKTYRRYREDFYNETRLFIEEKVIKVADNPQI